MAHGEDKREDSKKHLNGMKPIGDWHRPDDMMDGGEAVPNGADGPAANGAKRGRPRKTGDEKNDNYQMIVEAMARALIGETTNEFGLPLDGMGISPSNILIHHTLDKDGGMEYIAVDPDKTVILLSERRLHALVAEFVKGKNHAAWTKYVGKRAAAKDIKAIVEHLYLIAPKITDTIVSYAPVGWEGYAYNRASLDVESLAIERPRHKRSYPTIKEKFLDRISNHKSMMAFFGSLFFPESDRSQYLYLYGEGGTGKDRLGHMIFEFFRDTNACIKGQSSSFDKSGDKHFTYSIRGARLCIFGECDDFNIPNSPMFKDITGTNRLTIRPMYKTPYTAYVDTKFMFLSNTKPNTERQVAAARRIIYCEIEPFDGEAMSVGVLDKILASEREDFLLDCYDEYRQAMIQDGVLYHGVIPTDKEALNNIADSYISETLEWFESTMVVGEHLYIKSTKEIRQAASELLGMGVSFFAVKKFLERRGLKYGVKKINGKSAKVWVGMSIKTSLTSLKMPDSFMGNSMAWSEYLRKMKGESSEDPDAAY